MNKNEVISNLREISSILKNNKYITLKDLRSKPGLEYYVYYHFGRLGNALQAANLPSSKLAASMKVTNEQLLSYLSDLRDSLTHNPSVFDIGRDEKIYKKYSERKFSWSIFKSRFGGLRKALEQIESVGEIKNSQIIPSKKRKKQDSASFEHRNRFFGKAAELHVTAELIYHGFQATNIPIDVGLDVLAIKNNKTFYFQIKHKDFSNNIPIKLTKSSFDQTGGGSVYFVFVLLLEEEEKEKRDFLIIPFHIVNDWIRDGLVDEKEEKYIIDIKREGHEYKLQDKNLNNNYLNQWENIR